jgi:hypothetical protein
MEYETSQLIQEIIEIEKFINDITNKGQNIKDTVYSVLSRYYYYLFIINKDENTFNSAIANINKAILQDSKNMKYLASRAMFYMSANKYDIAEKDINIIRNSNKYYMKKKDINKMYVETIIKKFDKNIVKNNT